MKPVAWMLTLCAMIMLGAGSARASESFDFRSASDTAPLSLEQAWTVFVRVCFETGNDPDAFEDFVSRGGFARQPSGWYYYPEAALRMVHRSHAAHRTCQVVFQSGAAPEDFRNMVLEGLRAEPLPVWTIIGFLGEEDMEDLNIHMINSMDGNGVEINGTEVNMAGFVFESLRRSTFGLLVQFKD